MKIRKLQGKKIFNFATWMQGTRTNSAIFKRAANSRTLSVSTELDTSATTTK
jgi:hypothetical protein